MANASSPSVGKSKLPLRELYLPAVLNILTIGAKELCEKHQVTPAMPENTITYMLEREMRRARIAGIIKGYESDIISWFIRPIMPDETIHDHLATVEVDLMFTWGTYPSEEDPSLAVEAKRVNGKGSSLAGDYVRKGVLRFVNGKYGRGHDYGIVMAYVAVPPVSHAVDKVKVTMNKLKPLTNQLSEFVADMELCKHPFTHKSKHSQQGSPIPITLVHLFIDFS